MRIFYLLTSLMVAATSPALAQGNPRDFDRPGPAKERQMYYAQVRHEVHQTLLRWKNAWDRDDAKDVASFYADEASYLPPEAQPAHTRNAIRDYFVSFLKTVSDVKVDMTDFGTSGDIAYFTGRLTYFLQLAPGEVKPTVRTDVIILRRNAFGAWKIQTQLARVEPLEKPLP
jgi:uncharacterized protein (TIGR02246 family)